MTDIREQKREIHMLTASVGRHEDGGIHGVGKRCHRSTVLRIVAHLQQWLRLFLWWSVDD